MKIFGIDKDDLRKRIIIFLNRAQDAKENSNNKSLKTSDIANSRTIYKKFKMECSFGMGNLANVPWIVFLTSGFKASNGVYPYIGANLKDNKIISNIGFSQQNKIFLNNQIHEDINKFNKKNNYEIKVESFRDIKEDIIDKLINLIDQMINLFNKLNFNTLENININTYITNENFIKKEDGIYFIRKNYNYDKDNYNNLFDLQIIYKNKGIFLENALKGIFIDKISTMSYKDNESFINLSDKDKNLIQLNNSEEVNFITQIQSDLFYRQIVKEFDLEISKYFLSLIHDAGTCKNRIEFKDFIDLTNNSLFNKSLIRSQSAYYAHKKGALFISNDDDLNDLNDLEFNFNFKVPQFNDKHQINLSFKKQNFYNGSINLLIGKNGLGKSFSLKKLIDYLSYDKFNELIENKFISKRITTNKLLVLSNVYDDNYVSKKNDMKKNYFNNVDYKYINLLKNKTFSSQEKIIESINLVKSLKEILKYQVLGYQKINKIKILKEALKECIKFDQMLVKTKEKEFKEIPWDESDENILDFINLIEDKYELIFQNNGNEIFFSSGQATFIKYIFYILAFIEQDSLLLIDEPENFLHPNFEMELIKILYKILDLTNSICLIATHSSYIAREISAKYINVFIEFKDNIVIDNPNIETYGSNLERISNYVFSDLNKTNRYYYENLKILTKNKNFDDVIKEFGNNLNSETYSNIRRLING